MLTILENSQISPPPATVDERSLPLTFLDTAWLLFFPIHEIFFYEFHHSKSHFIQTTIPNLKHSLSITLQHFFPFASKLIVFPQDYSKKPEIRYVEGDSVAITFAECSLDFNDLTGNHPRECEKFYPLLPLPGRPAKVCDYIAIPFFSVQVTLFPNSGISIGLTNFHSLCDASTNYDFLKAWTSIARHGTDELFLASGSLPFYDRSVIKYPNSLDEMLLNQPGIQSFNTENWPPQLVSHTDKDNVRATIILTQAHIIRLKKWLSTELPKLEYISSFSVACAYVWSCIAKSRNHLGEMRDQDELERFTCAADCRARFDPPIPQTYFGNCVVPCVTTATKRKLLSGNKGFLTAAELVGNSISEMLKNKDGIFKDAKAWLERVSEPVSNIGVAGSPKFKIYDLDFGWGKPKKFETISIDYNGSVSINTCKESPKDLEIGLSLPAKQMDSFITIFENELESIFYEKNE